MGEKCGKLYFQFAKSQKGHYSYENRCELSTLELDLLYSKTIPTKIDAN